MKVLYILILSFLILLAVPVVAQDTDALYKVAKPKLSVSILPDLDRLRSGMTYAMLVTNVKVSQIKKAQANTLGSIEYKQAANGRDVELKLKVTESYAQTGTLIFLADADKVLLKKEYKIIATARFLDYTSGLPGLSSKSVVLFLNKDSLANNGTVSVKQLQNANSLSLYDTDLADKSYIRKNLMCAIRLIHDTMTTLVHSALDHLSDKVKQKLTQMKAGDKIIIDRMEVLWIDAKRDDHIEPYGTLSYELTVID